ncbi:MAG: FMN-binding protein [Limnochordia bacterium]
MPTGPLASGLFGEIEVEVLIDGGQIADVVVVNHQETPTIAQAAFRKVISASGRGADL